VGSTYCRYKTSSATNYVWNNIWEELENISEVTITYDRIRFATIVIASIENVTSQWSIFFLQRYFLCDPFQLPLQSKQTGSERGSKELSDRHWWDCLSNWSISSNEIWFSQFLEYCGWIELPQITKYRRALLKVSKHMMHIPNVIFKVVNYHKGRICRLRYSV